MLNTLSSAPSSLKPDRASKHAGLLVVRSAAAFLSPASKFQYYSKTIIEFQSSVCVCVCEERKHFSQDLLHVCYCVGCFDSAAQHRPCKPRAIGIGSNFYSPSNWGWSRRGNTKILYIQLLSVRGREIP